MRVTDEQARAAMEAYYAAFRFGKQGGFYYSEDERLEAMRAALEAALSHAAGQEADKQKWFDAGWEKCKLLTPGEVCRFFASGPEGSFFTKTPAEAENLIDFASFDRDEWTVTDLLDPTEPAVARSEGEG